MKMDLPEEMFPVDNKEAIEIAIQEKSENIITINSHLKEAARPSLLATAAASFPAADVVTRMVHRFTGTEIVVLIDYSNSDNSVDDDKLTLLSLQKIEDFIQMYNSNGSKDTHLDPLIDTIEDAVDGKKSIKILESKPELEPFIYYSRLNSVTNGALINKDWMISLLER